MHQPHVYSRDMRLTRDACSCTATPEIAHLELAIDSGNATRWMYQPRVDPRRPIKLYAKEQPQGPHGDNMGVAYAGRRNLGKVPERLT